MIRGAAPRPSQKNFFLRGQGASRVSRPPPPWRGPCHRRCPFLPMPSTLSQYVVSYRCRNSCDPAGGARGEGASLPVMPGVGGAGADAPPPPPFPLSGGPHSEGPSSVLGGSAGDRGDGGGRPARRVGRGSAWTESWGGGLVAWVSPSRGGGTAPSPPSAADSS